MGSIDEFDRILGSIENKVTHTKSDEASIKDPNIVYYDKESWQSKKVEDQYIFIEENRYIQDTILRKHLAYSVICIIVGWLISTIGILLLNSWLFELDVSVLITLLGTSMATVLGLAQIVLKGFFKYMNQDIKIDNNKKAGE